jgi:hypothetical protein
LHKSLLVDETQIAESIAQAAGIVSDISVASQEQSRGLKRDQCCGRPCGQHDAEECFNGRRDSVAARGVAGQARRLTSLVDTFVIDEPLEALLLMTRIESSWKSLRNIKQMAASRIITR